MKEKENRYGVKSAKRVLATALAVLMLMTLLPAAALATGTAPVMTGSGTKEAPYELGSSEDVSAMLQHFKDDENDGTTYYLNAHYKLTANITLPADFEWNSEYSFGGVLDGNSKTLDGLKTEAMFLMIGSGGVVKNLTLGSGCRFSYAAFADENYGTVTDCTNNGAVTSDYEAAGIVLENYGTVTGCTNNGAVTTDYAAAGIVMENEAGGVVSSCVNNGTITAEYPVGIVAIGTEGESCTNNGQLIVKTIDISDYTLSDGVMVYREGGMVDVKGLYKGQYLSTTYDDDGYYLDYDDSVFSVEAKPAFVNKNNFVKLEYVLTAKADVTDGKFAIHTDVQIGENDSAPISLLYDADGKPIGLKMVDNDNLTRGAQFNLFFSGTYGVTDVSSYWFGYYGGSDDDENMYGTIADQLGEPTEVNGWTKDEDPGKWKKTYESGKYVYSDADGLQLTGTDSGMAVSWQGISLKQGQTTTVSILLGIGNADMKPPVAQTLTYDEGGNKASFTVKDEEASWVNDTIQNGSTILYSLDGGTETEVKNAVITKESADDTYTYTFALPGLSEGFHTISVWAMNDAGMLSGTKTLNISRWSVPTYTVTGGITPPTQGGSVEGFTVTLKKGSDVYSQTVTDENGAYTFEKVPAGVYNIVIETPDGRTMTKQVEVKADKTQLEDIAIPDGNKNTVVEAKPGTPPVVADGLNELYNAPVTENDEGVTQTDLDTVANDGGSIDLKLTVEGLEENVAGGAESIKTEAGDKTVGLYLDIAINKIVKGSDGNVIQAQSAALSEIQSLVTIRLTLPEAHRGQKDYVVYRMHEGAVDTLTQEPNANGEYFELEGNDLIIHVNRFSTYALAYTAVTPPTDVVIPAPKPEITEPKNGSVTVSPEMPIIGGRVTVIPTPDEGYKVGAVTVTDQNGNKITVTPTENGSFSFVQPIGRVTVTVSFIKAGELPFTDVAKSDWFYDSAKYVYENGLMSGTSDTVFSPYLNTDRGMIITILWRLDGEPKADKAVDFTDVLPGAYYTDACAWGAEKGIIDGYGDGRYGPADPMTREQLVSILWRYAQYKGYDVSVGEDTNILSYKDADEISEYAIPALQWACGAGIIQGRGDGILDPQGHALRAETAVMLTRFTENTIK